jgi:hypothetical protein
MATDPAFGALRAELDPKKACPGLDPGWVSDLKVLVACLSPKFAVQNVGF